MKFRVQPIEVLFLVLISAVFLNYKLYTHMDQISGDVDNTNWNIQLEQAKSNKLEVNQDRYIKSLEHRKLAFETVDTMYAAYQYMFRVIVIFNVTLIAFLCAYAGWLIFKLKENS